MYYKKKIALLLVIATILSVLCSCNDESDEVSFVDLSDVSDVTSQPNVLVVGCSELSGVFNPFYTNTASDLNLLKICSENLLTFDREGTVIENAIDGETVKYNGEEYSYSGIANIETEIKDDGSMICSIVLREDVKFSDGEIMDADDAIFTMYVLSDPSYDGYASFYTLPISGIKEYRKGNAESISGIVKNSQFEFEIVMDSYDFDYLSKLSFIVAPLHYYGDVELYNYESDQFGFEKGNLDSIKENISKPLGVGPYVFDKYEDGVVYFSRNQYYYKGVANIPFVEFREIEDNEKVNELLNGNIHISDIDLEKDTVELIKSNNGGELTGSVIKTYTVDSSGYGYIGISADAVKVGNDKSSYESKCLRKAFATVFSVYRESAINDYYGESAKVIDYPISTASCLYPNTDNADYEIAFSKDINGNCIFNDEMTEDEKHSASIESAREFLIAAGYTYDECSGKFISAPEGAKLSYEVIISADGKGDHPSYSIFENAKDAFAEIGITLLIKDVENSSALWNSLDNGEYEIWAGAWYSKTSHDLYQVYHSDNVIGAGGTNSNYYNISDIELDYLVLSLRRRTDSEYINIAYNDCFDIIFDWGVEIPIYQKKEAVIINNYAVDTSAILCEYTNNYIWINDIAFFKMSPVFS